MPFSPGRPWLATVVLLVAPIFLSASAVTSDMEISIDVKANGQHVQSTATESIRPRKNRPRGRCAG